MNTEIKYRPATLDEFIFADEKLRVKIEQFASGQNMTPLILHGPNGTGKSVLAELIPKAIEGKSDVKVTKVSAEELNTKKEVRETFTRSATFDNLFETEGQSRSYTIVEEVNFETKAKSALRVALDEMLGREQLIFTTNELEKMDRGLRSRAEVVEVPPVTPDKFFPRAKYILAQEKVELPDDVLMQVLESVYERHHDNREYYKAMNEIIYRTSQQTKRQKK